jgi:ligand-binding sensor domain-containing protein/DNA-binding CsgD family transcriptional regulator
MKKSLFLLASLFGWLMATCQNTIGIPNIVNYPKMVYQAGSQNWNIGQDRNGIMYFANNAGLLSFDGAFWRTYSLPNKTIVRSLAVAPDGRIYVGGQEEIGYFFPDKKGELVYTSLKNLLPPNDNDFADVWNTCVSGNLIFFRSNRRILVYDQHKITVHKSINWTYLSATPGEVIAVDYEKGLVSYQNGQWLPRIKQGKLPAGFQLRGTVTIGKDSILLPSQAHGLFILHGDTLTSFETPYIHSISDKNIYGACMLSPNRIAVITNLAGCIIINKKGEFIQRFTKREGIQNNNILSLMFDKDKNLWLGLDNGIDLITYSNAIKTIFPDTEDRNSGYTSIIHDNRLYVGVSTGVYTIPLAPGTDDLSYTNGTFRFVKNSEGQAWNLSEVNGVLLMGHNKGAFRVEGEQATMIDDKTGFWEFQPLYKSNPSPVILVGTYNGINFYNYDKGVITNPKMHAQFESARFVVRGNGIIWIAHPYKGLYKVIFNDKGVPEASVYQDKKKILSGNHNKLFRIQNKIILTNDNGIFEYDEREKDFIRSQWLEKIFEKTPVSYLKEDSRGNIWFCRDKKVGIVDMSSGTPHFIFIPELNDKIMAGGFEHINIVDSNNVFIAGEKGFFHINYAEYRKSKLPLHVLIRDVRSTIKKDGLIYGGYLDPSARTSATEPSIEHRYNSLHFECSSTLYGQEQNTEYSYYLKGFDKDWSAWTRKTEKDYTNLPAGNYIFQVKCRNNIDNESPVATYSFNILSPWYQTWWAFSIYAIGFFYLLYLFYKRQQRKYKRLQQIKLQEQQRKYDEEQKQLQFQHQLELGENEKQIIRLKNEKLEAEVTHKNTELASSAMNLVRKKEMLSKLREDLVQYRSTADIDKGGKEFQKIIRVIDKELDHDQEWEQFAGHFDSVHTNYLKKLKEYCPELTASDLKLAAYLRLSLSTKEIAQLMNISIRGVETSRYRLRKKLDLANETSLFDFLIRITS